MSRAARVAVIGSGIAGLAAARELSAHAAVTLFEAEPRFGGHAHTVDVTLPAGGRLVTHGVDTGFLVFNDRTYPGLIRLFGELGVERAPSDMSFSVQAPLPGAATLEWGGASLATVFAQRRNLLRPRFWSMLADLLRFNRLATRLATELSASAPELPGEGTASLDQPLGDFLDEHRFGVAFRDWYLLPMLGCIWSCPTDQMLRFPVATMVRFCHNHGLIQLTDRPQWWTVKGGSREYVRRIVSGLADTRTSAPVSRLQPDANGVWVTSPLGREHFDAAVVATHTDQALAMLAEPTQDERAVLGAIRYQPNRAVLHTDASVLPQRRAVWSAWNYEREPRSGPTSAQVCLHYLINRLQPLPWSQPVIVSLNPQRPIDPNRVVGEFEYAHPVFDLAAARAQSRLHAIQGRRGVWFCGAWAGYGFHEDGLKAGLAAARGVMQALPARATDPASEAACA